MKKITEMNKQEILNLFGTTVYDGVSAETNFEYDTQQICLFTEDENENRIFTISIDADNDEVKYIFKVLR